MAQNNYDWMMQPNSGLAQPMDLTLAGGNVPGGGGNFGFGSTDGLNLPGGGGEGFDFGNALSNFSLGAQGIAGLAGAYNSFQQNKMLGEQLGLQRQALTANDAANVKAHNIGAKSRANIGSQLLTGAEFGSAAQQASEADIYGEQSLAKTNFG